jgi:hypothetical protein
MAHVEAATDKPQLNGRLGREPELNSDPLTTDQSLMRTFLRWRDRRTAATLRFLALT